MSPGARTPIAFKRISFFACNVHGGLGFALRGGGDDDVRGRRRLNVWGRTQLVAAMEEESV
ncbi:hypothetical protein Trco_006775 [Trichoderma cornu-damae]|uniref:Uncharacterized protein n=1 Tax=Trichoderma cornu-damae TaxID=654480 RepID=A0A9P8QLW5_9HYPO|nr:hypothetical protein Trco_006775 [Trichoderma cornu-damae]